MTPGFFPKTTPQNLDLCLTPAADLCESSSKLPWPIHQYSYESSLEMTMVQPFLLLSWKLRTPLHMDVSSWAAFTSKTLESHSSCWHTIAISVTTLLRSIHQKKQHRKILVDCMTDAFRQDTSSQGGRSLEIPRRFGSVQKGRKKEPWKVDVDPNILPSPLNDTGNLKELEASPLILQHNKKTASKHGSLQKHHETHGNFCLMKTAKHH